MENDNIIVKGIEVSYKRINEEDYINITDLAKYVNEKDPSGVIRNWMSNKDAFHFYSLWEIINNKKFNSAQMHIIKNNEVGYNRFTMTPKRWKEEFFGTGIIPSAGKYSEGTYAHKDIAFEFASWLSPEFKLYLITEFQRLKKEEYKSVEWNAKRELAKVNYKIQTSAINNNLIVPELTKEQINYVYASEADMLNVALFGTTASEWRKENKKLEGNMRDYASVEQLLVLANMESYNAMLIEQGLESKDRIVLLNNMAKSQMKVLLKNNLNRLVKN